MRWLEKLQNFKNYLLPVNPREFGILGMNARNIDYILNYNPRKYYKIVDDKLMAKQIASDAGICVPQLFETIEFIHDIKRVTENLTQYVNGFVIKPVAGSGGGGIIVVKEIKGNYFLTSSGALLTKRHLAYHMSNILAGLYSLGGRPDKVMVEQLIHIHPIFDKISFKGVPDIRVIVFKGYPIMAMLRLPTRQSDGKANLHIGGIGVGIDLETGQTTYGFHRNKYITHHTETFEPLANLQLPNWQETLQTAAKMSDILPLGYIGCDFIYDAMFGLNLLEANARPGLAVQLANKAGLKPRLEKVEQHILQLKHANMHENYIERAHFVQENFA